MTVTEAPAVVSRHESIEAMRAELAGVTAERDALKAELEDAAWERDQAQNESAFLREDVLHVEWRPFLDDATPPERTIGLLLTSGDTPPAPPADIALISLSTGATYVRARNQYRDAWCEYGQDTVQADWSNLAQRGPWITTATFGLLDHQSKADRRRALFTSIHNARPYHPDVVKWPENATWALDAVKALGRDFRSVDRPDAWIDALSTLVSACRSAWLEEHNRANKLTEQASS